MSLGDINISLAFYNLAVFGNKSEDLSLQRKIRRYRHILIRHDKAVGSISIVGQGYCLLSAVNNHRYRFKRKASLGGSNSEVYRLTSKSVCGDGDGSCALGIDYRRDAMRLAGIVGINPHFIIRHDEGVFAGLRIVGMVQNSQIGTIGHLHLV